MRYLALILLLTSSAYADTIHYHAGSSPSGSSFYANDYSSDTGGGLESVNWNNLHHEINATLDTDTGYFHIYGTLSEVLDYPGDPWPEWMGKPVSIDISGIIPADQFDYENGTALQDPELKGFKTHYPFYDAFLYDHMGNVIVQQVGGRMNEAKLGGSPLLGTLRFAFYFGVPYRDSTLEIGGGWRLHAIPEPSSLLLFSASMLAAGMARRRSR